MACAGALVGGMALGWAHGAETMPNTEMTAVATSAPVEGDSEPAVGVTQAPGFEQVPYEGKVYAIGDSVLAGAEPCLTKLGYVVSARQSRQTAAGLDVLRDKGKRIPARVLVHLGTNGGATSEDLAAIMAALGTQRLVVWPRSNCRTTPLVTRTRSERTPPSRSWLAAMTTCVSSTGMRSPSSPPGGSISRAST